MQALAVLAELSSTGTRKVPASAPHGFVPARFRDYLTRAQRQNDTASPALFGVYRDVAAPCGDVPVHGPFRDAGSAAICA